MVDATQFIGSVVTTLLACTSFKGMFDNTEQLRFEFVTFVYDRTTNQVYEHEVFYPSKKTSVVEYMRFKSDVDSLVILQSQNFRYVGGYVRKKKSGNVVVCRFYNKNYKSSKDRERCEPEGQYIVAKEHFLYLPSRHDIPSRMFRTHDSVEKDNIQLFDIPAGVNEDSDTFAYVKNGECSEVQFATNVWKQLPCDKTKFSIKYGKTNYYSLTYIAARTGCEFNIDRDQLLNTYVRFRTSDYSEETDLSILYICIGVIAGIVLLCVVCVVCCKCISWKKKKAGAPKKKKKSKEKKKKKKKPKKETTEVEETESQTVEKKKKKPKKKKKTKKETTEQEETESQSQTAEKKSKKKKDETNNEETNEKGETEKSKSKSGKSGQSGSNPPQSPKQQSSNPKKRTVHDVIPPYEGLGKAVGKSPSKSKDSKTKNSKDKDGFSMQTF